MGAAIGSPASESASLQGGALDGALDVLLIVVPPVLTTVPVLCVTVTHEWLLSEEWGDISSQGRRVFRETVYDQHRGDLKLEKVVLMGQ